MISTAIKYYVKKVPPDVSPFCTILDGAGFGATGVELELELELGVEFEVDFILEPWFAITIC